MADDQISVGITADTSSLSDQFSGASQTIQGSLDELRTLIGDIAAQLAKLGGTAKDNLSGAKKSTDDWGKAIASVQHTFQQSVTGLILGTTTWQKTVQKVAQTAVSQLVNMAKVWATSWITGEQAQSDATAAGVKQRNATQSAGQSQGLAQMAMGALKAIGTDAATAASGAYSSASQIPYVGWILGPIAAAAAFAAVMAFGSGIPSAAGGLWNVPSDTLAMVHKQETIIPASIATPMRDFFSGGGASSGDSYAITIQAIDTQSGAQFLMNNASVIAKGLAREVRNASTVLRNARS